MEASTTNAIFFYSEKEHVHHVFHAPTSSLQACKDELNVSSINQQSFQTCWEAVQRCAKDINSRLNNKTFQNITKFLVPRAQVIGDDSSHFGSFRIAVIIAHINAADNEETMSGLNDYLRTNTGARTAIIGPWACADSGTAIRAFVEQFTTVQVDPQNEKLKRSLNVRKVRQTTRLQSDTLMRAVTTAPKTKSDPTSR